MPVPFDTVFCVVAERDDLTEAHRNGVLRHMNGLVATSTTGQVVLSVHGYDEDPRELWDIPEVRAYLAEFANGLSMDVFKRLDQLSQSLLGVCCGALKPTRDQVTGNTRFERA